MGLTPTQKAVMGTFINGRNAVDDFLQFSTNNGGTVFGWIDAGGILRGTLASGSSPAGPATSVQVNGGTSLSGDSGFTYNSASGVVEINTTGPSFAAPVITPGTPAASTWGYVIVARQGTVNIATSAEGRTTTGSNIALFGSGNSNAITWTAVPGATAYDVFLSTSSSTPLGYITTVVTTNYTDIGNPAPSGVTFLPPTEAGYVEDLTGAHVGNMTWADVFGLSANNHFITSAGYAMDSPFNVLKMETSAPPSHGTLTQSPDFAAANFIAYANGSNRTAVGVNALAISNTGATNGISGMVATGINLPVGTQNFNAGITSAAVNLSAGNLILNMAYYASTTTALAITGTVTTVANYYGDVYVGVKTPANVQLYASFYASQGGASAHANAGAAALTAAFYTQDTGTGATDWSFYSAGGNSFFGGTMTIGNGAIGTPSIKFNQAGVNGFWSAANGNVNVVSNSQDVFNFNISQIRVGAAIPFGFCSGGPSATGLDTALSRVSANVMAVGNGTASDVSGTLEMGAAVVTAATRTGSAGQVSFGTTTATSATAGANGAVPAQVAAYLTIDIAGTKFKVPYFNV